MSKKLLDEANVLSTKIAKLISEQRSSILSKLIIDIATNFGPQLSLHWKLAVAKDHLVLGLVTILLNMMLLMNILLILLLIHAMTLVSLRNLLILHQFLLSLEEFCSMNMTYEDSKMLTKVKKLLSQLTNCCIGCFVNMLAVDSVVTHVFNVIISSGTPSAAWKVLLSLPFLKLVNLRTIRI
jgi:hypothetical protein